MASARASGALLLFALAACSKSDPKPAPAPPAPPPVAPPAAGSAGSAAAAAPTPVEEPGSWYHAKLTYEGVGELPFFLHLPPPGQNGRAYVVNDTETTDLTAEWRDEELTVTGPWNYVTVIEAELDAKTRALTGTWTRDTPLWGKVVLPFAATPVDRPDPRVRFPVTGTPAPPTGSVAGTWKFAFKEHKDGKGLLRQDADGVVRGYIKPGQLGDIRFLEGALRGSKLSLAHWNGNAANLVIADVSADGTTMTGLMSLQNQWNEPFTATKVPDFPFEQKVKLKGGASKVSLLGLDKYQGKPTLAIIFATWCSSCNDAAPYLKDLYAKYHPQGLEVMAVAYDLNDDRAANQAEIDRFRAKYGIPWELLQVPCTTETWAKAMPKEIEGWDGLPINILVRPDGTVQSLFGGWFGPATGDEGAKLKAWFESEIDTLVATSRTSKPG